MSLAPTTDGVVTIRAPHQGDGAILVAGRDEQFHRFLGAGSDDPQPTGCIVVGDRIVGWVDYDCDRDWLADGEVNLGYNVFAGDRGRGYATRAVQLLMHHLAMTGSCHTATLLIDADNRRSLAIAARTGFQLSGEIDEDRYYTRSVPALTYSDGVVSIRRQCDDDLDGDIAAKDDEQMRWLWLTGQRASWEAMTRDEQRAHALRVLRANRTAFDHGPKWSFAVDSRECEYVAYVDCDLANEHVEAGEANISYASHPAHRGRGYVSRAVLLVAQFVREHTGARTAHLIVDERNLASLRVAAAVGARPTGTLSDEPGRTLIRHELAL